MIPHCECRVNEVILLVTVMQYPVMSGSAPVISSVNGGIHVMKTLEPFADIIMKPTASRRPKTRSSIQNNYELFIFEANSNTHTLTNKHSLETYGLFTGTALLSHNV